MGFLWVFGFLPHEEHRNANIDASERDLNKLYKLFRNCNDGCGIFIGVLMMVVVYL